MSFYSGGKKFVQIVFLPFFRIVAEFEESFPMNQGVILACNHVSDLDPIMLGIACPAQVHYMAKQELFQIPVLGFVIRKLGAFPVARGKGDTSAINYAVKIVRDGGVLGIFPEGDVYKRQGRTKSRGDRCDSEEWGCLSLCNWRRRSTCL